MCPQRPFSVACCLPACSAVCCLSVHRMRPAPVTVHSPPCLSAFCSRDSAGCLSPAQTSESISFLAETKQSKPTCARRDQPVFVWTSLANSGKSEAVSNLSPNYRYPPAQSIHRLRFRPRSYRGESKNSFATQEKKKLVIQRLG